MHNPLAVPQVSTSSPSHKNNRFATLAATLGSQTRVALCLLLVWMLVCQTLMPTSWRVQGKPTLKTESETSSGNRETGKQLAGSAANSVLDAAAPVDPQPDMLMDAVISRTHPNISGGRIEGTLRLLQGESFALGGRNLR